jgi:hypothetical protein
MALANFSPNSPAKVNTMNPVADTTLNWLNAPNLYARAGELERRRRP